MSAACSEEGRLLVALCELRGQAGTISQSRLFKTVSSQRTKGLWWGNKELLSCTLKMRLCKQCHDKVGASSEALLHCTQPSIA